MGKPNPNWKEKVREWESSNKSTKEWCRENQIPYTTLLGWRDRLKKADHKKASIKQAADFVELKDNSLSDSGIVLEYHGVKIQLKREFDKTVLRECLECLRGYLC